MTNKIILPYELIGYINSFLPRPVHPISKLIKEYINMHNITNKFITVERRHGLPPNESWKFSFYDYMIELRFCRVNEVFNKRNYYFYMHPSFDYEFNCLLIRRNAYRIEMNTYD
jgi:hypothetical protein